MTPFFLWVSPLLVVGQVSWCCAGNLWPKQYRLLACDKLQAVQDSEGRSRFAPRRQTPSDSPAECLRRSSLERASVAQTPRRLQQFR